MSHWLTKEEYLLLFKLLETDFSKFLEELKNIKFELKTRQQISSAIYLIKKKYKIFLENGKDINQFMNTKKSRNKCTKNNYLEVCFNASKDEDKKKNLLDLFNDLDDNAKEEILKQYLEMLKEKDKKSKYKKIKKAMNKSGSSTWKFSAFYNISQSTISRLKRKQFLKQNDFVSKRTKSIVDLIIKIEKRFHWFYGCRKVRKMMLKYYNINLSYVYINRLMKRFNISVKIRIKRPKRQKESKNTKVSIPDLCKRDFNQTKHKNPVFSTDVSFIPATSDFIKRQNFIYFSVLFDHKTKTVMSWSLSPFNDVNLVLTDNRPIYVLLGKIPSFFY